MKANKNLLSEIKKRVLEHEPDARVILYGSYARGDANTESDMDLLILVNKEQLGFNEKMKISSPLYRLGLENDLIMSPLIQPKKIWEDQYYFTPLFYNISKEGIEL